MSPSPVVGLDGDAEHSGRRRKAADSTVVTVESSVAERGGVVNIGKIERREN